MSALNIEAAVAKDEWTNKKNYLLLGDFYFNHNFSIGAAFSDYDAGTTYGLSVKHFFIETASIEANYYRVDTNKEYDDFYDSLGSRNIWSVTLSARF